MGLEGRFNSASPATRFQYVDVHFPLADVDVAVPHTLNPAYPEQVSYQVLQLNGPAIVYHDASSDRRKWATGEVLLRASIANTKARILLTTPASEAVSALTDFGALGVHFSPGTGLERGTWTPALHTESGTDITATLDIAVGLWVKWGPLVYIEGIIRTSAVTIGGATAEVLVTGLPYPNMAAPPYNRHTPVTVGVSSDWVVNPNRGYMLPSESTIHWHAVDGTEIVPADLNTGANSNLLSFSTTYLTE